MKPMKRHIFLFLLILMPGIHSTLDAQVISCENHFDEGEIIIHYKSPKYNIQDTILPDIFGNKEVYSQISLNNDEFGITDIVGMPCLPKISFDINLPPESYNITLHVIDSTAGKVSLKKKIVPFQEDFNPEDSTLISFSFNNSYYKSSKYFSSDRATVSAPYKIRDRQGVGVTIFPFMYSSKKNELKILKSADFVIKFKRKKSETSKPDSPVFEDYFANYFKNYEASSSPKNGINYLIITTKDFEEELQPFVDYKTQNGYTVDIIANADVTLSPYNVKNAIQEKFNNAELRPDYLLLVGDAKLIPPAQGDTSEEDNPITDLPYALLDGDDLEPDIFIGRWPVSKNDELHNIIRKTIYMEMNMQQLDKRALFISGDHKSDEWYLFGADEVYMRECFEIGHEYAINNTFEPEGYSCEIRYQPYLQTVKNWMEWNPLLFAYSGHGWPTGMGPLYRDDPDTSYIFNRTIPLFNNTTFPMVFAFACKTGKFGKAKGCIGNIWVCSPKGAVSYLGSSVTSNSNHDIVIEQKLFGGNFFSDNTRSLGKIIALGMRRYRNFYMTGEDKAKLYSKSYNLLGDPSFLVRGLACPSEYTINGENMILKNNKEYHASEKITIGHNSVVEPGCSLTLTAGKEIVFEDGFEAVNGAFVDAHIEGCTGVLYANTKGVNSNAYSNPDSFFQNSEPQPSSSFRIYPNPAKDYITLEFDSQNARQAEIEIYNPQGVPVYHNSIQVPNEGIQTITLPLTSITTPGIYIVTLSLDNNTSSETLIIQ